MDSNNNLLSKNSLLPDEDFLRQLEVPYNVSGFICDSEKIIAKNPTNRYAFHLTGTHAAHGVEQVPEDDDTSRVTAFMVCRVKPKEYAELLERSVEKYKDYAVWW